MSQYISLIWKAKDHFSNRPKLSLEPAVGKFTGDHISLSLLPSGTPTLVSVTPQLIDTKAYIISVYYLAHHEKETEQKGI